VLGEGQPGTAPAGAGAQHGSAPGPPGERPEGVRGASLLRLAEVMDTLRVKCPWDARQTHESLAPHLLEECYEALEALETGGPAELRDELGDVLLQVFFHARIAAERTDGTGYTIDDVADAIASKLVRRHPHVFGDVTVSGAEEVKQNWDAIKAAERAEKGGGPGSVVDSVPFGQPALALAAQLQRRAERAGAPAGLARFQPAQPPPGGAASSAGPPQPAGTGAPQEANGPGGQAPAGEVSAIGAELFALVARAREAGLDPESELRTAARHYAARVRDWERAGGSST
jgi:XTP/dITP diphosphohydrolase